jgi:glycosyltransferase involved in cell wall biosynthesis
MVQEVATARFCVLVPAYQEEKRIGEVVAGIRRHCPSILVIDDGSTDATADRACEAGAEVIRHPVNKGKGAALHTGFQAALQRAYDFVITMDADGQHAPDDIPGFLQACADGRTDVLVGTRMDRAKDMPFHRKLTNYFMSWLLSREMGQWVPDTQCGYRLYSARAIRNIPEGAQRFAAESEVLLVLANKGFRFGAVPIQVIYRDEKSKIRPMLDTFRFFKMLHDHRRARGRGA